jgi:lipoprotein-releasing system permease protein
MQLEKTLITIVLGLLLLAGIVGIWVTVTILVRQKRKSIGIMRSMGLPVNSIIAIFTLHSMLTGLIAALCGASLGVFLASNLEGIIKLMEGLVNSLCEMIFRSCTPVQIMPDNIYYFDHLPVRIETDFLMIISIVLLFLSGLAGYFPSRKAALESPVETIRNL